MIASEQYLLGPLTVKKSLFLNLEKLGKADVSHVENVVTSELTVQSKVEAGDDHILIHQYQGVDQEAPVVRQDLEVAVLQCDKRNTKQETGIQDHPTAANLIEKRAEVGAIVASDEAEIKVKEKSNNEMNDLSHP